MHLVDTFIQSDLQCIQATHFFISMCVPWELNPERFALLTQYSTTEPEEQIIKFINTGVSQTIFVITTQPNTHVTWPFMQVQP